MAFFDSLGTVLGPFLVPFGGSWDASWKGLEGSRGILYEILEHVCKTHCFCKDSLSQRRSKDILERLSFGISSAAERSEAALDDMLEADPTT